MAGRSPFRPDKTHLHHLFIDMGFSHLGAALFILFLNLLVVASWFAAYQLGASIDMQTYIVILLGVGVTFGFYKLMRVQQKISAELEAEKVGSVMRVIIDRQEGDWYVGRTEFCSPEVDPEVLIPADEQLTIGEFYEVRITDAEEFDLYATTKI